MEPLTAIVGYVALKFIDQFVKDEGYGRLKKIFFPQQRYVNRLVNAISDTINKFEKLTDYKKKQGKINFYHSKEIFEELNNYVFFKKINQDLIFEKLKRLENVKVPTANEIEAFFKLFVENINKDSRLKKLFIEDNYQAEIFAISNLLGSLDENVQQISETTNTILIEVQNLSRKLDPRERPVIFSNYVTRQEEDNLLKLAIKNKVLLLTGVSFCGKSQLAKNISEKFVELGYKFIGVTDVNEGERILRSSYENLVVLLEDPFGHNSNSESSINLRRVQELIRNKPQNIILIVTSRIEIVYSINNCTILADCILEGNFWYDLTTLDIQFLIKSWELMCKNKRVDDNTKLQITNFLREANKNNILQVGQLNYLANIPSERIKNATIDQLLHLARIDSKEISIELQNRSKYSGQLFMILGLITTTTSPVSLNTLCYILNHKSKLLSIIDEEMGFAWTTFGAREKEKPSKYPSYSKDCEIIPEFLTELSFYQTRGFIDITSKQIIFTHPTYREAAIYTQFSNRIEQIKYLEMYLDKAISCIEPEVSIIASKQLKFIYKNTTSSDIKDLIKLKALKFSKESIFPGVQDVCFSFLIEIIEELGITDRQRVLRRLKGKLTDSQIRWEGKIPYIDPNYSSYFDDFDRESDKSKIDIIVENLNKGRETLISEIWDVIIYFKLNNCFSLNDLGVLEVLKSNEVFIRNEIAFMVLKNSFPHNKNILNAIFKDIHPSVIFEGMKGAIVGYSKYRDNEKEEIQSYVNEAISNYLVVIRANDFLTTFGIDYGSESIHWDSFQENEKKMIWELWAFIFPKFLNNYPENLRFSNTGRFGATLDHSKKYISTGQGLILSNAYYDWISDYIKREGLGDTYELAILSYLLEVTKDGLTDRFNLFEKIFSHEDTNFITYSLSSSFSYWNKLTMQEKKCILSLLNSGRIDKQWLHAVALTQDKVPTEVQELILGSTINAETEIEDILKLFSPQLLDDCLSVFCGHPQPLWWLGYHHNNKGIWLKIVKWILVNGYANGFDICLRELVFDGVNGFGMDWKKDGLIIWNDLCKKTTVRKKLAAQLIISTSECTCNIISTQQMWHSIIDSYLEDDPRELIDMIVSNLEALQYTHPEDVLSNFDRRFLEDHLMPSLPLDSLIMNLVSKIKRNETSVEVVNLIIESIIEVSKVLYVKLEVVLDNLEYMIEKSLQSYPELAKLKNLPNKIHEIGESQRKKMDDHYVLLNWNNTYVKKDEDNLEEEL